MYLTARINYLLEQITDILYNFRIQRIADRVSKSDLNIQNIYAHSEKCFFFSFFYFIMEYNARYYIVSLPDIFRKYFYLIFINKKIIYINKNILAIFSRIFMYYV